MYSARPEMPKPGHTGQSGLAVMTFDLACRYIPQEEGKKWNMQSSFLMYGFVI